MQGTGSFRLIVRRGPQPNQIYELSKDVITLGRDITNDIVINDPEVSRHHTRLTRGGGGYTLEDLGSTNGTFVNGQRLMGARPLSGGDQVGLGETVTLSYESTVAMAADLGQRPTMVGSSPAAPQPFYQDRPATPQPGAPPYPTQQPAATYSPSPPPPPQYQQQYPYQEQPLPTNTGMGRWFFIGCGCLIILCIVLTIGAAIVIDSNKDLRCNLPIVRNIYIMINPSSCQ
jgi:predicted component of type VI protein secretion system